MKKLWIVAGTISVALGVLGIFLPILPTTPFLLLTAFCYARGSKRFYDWLLNHSRFGVFIRNHQDGRGIPARQKALTIAPLWLTIGVTGLLLLPVGGCEAC